MHNFTKSKNKNQEQLNDAIQFIGTSNKSVLIFDGPINNINNILKDNNRVIQNGGLELPQMQCVLDNRIQLLQSQVNGIISSILVSCINLATCVSFDDLGIINVLPISGEEYIIPTEHDMEKTLQKFNINTLRPILFDRDGDVIFIRKYAQYKNLLLPRELIVEYVACITSNLYNILVQYVETEIDLCCVCAIIRPFYDNLLKAMLSFANNTDCYNIEYMNKTIDSMLKSCDYYY